MSFLQSKLIQTDAFRSFMFFWLSKALGGQLVVPAFECRVGYTQLLGNREPIPTAAHIHRHLLKSRGDGSSRRDTVPFHCPCKHTTSTALAIHGNGYP
ncbi:hypothetical protein D478_27454, partial [Brevibacillus agri BAB-2500]